MTFAVTVVFQPYPASVRYNAPGVRCTCGDVRMNHVRLYVHATLCLRSTKKLSAEVKFQDDVVKNRSDVDQVYGVTLSSLSSPRGQNLYKSRSIHLSPYFCFVMGSGTPKACGFCGRVSALVDICGAPNRDSVLLADTERLRLREPQSAEERSESATTVMCCCAAAELRVRVDFFFALPRIFGSFLFLLPSRKG